MQGVIAAVPTPVDPNGTVLTDLFLSHCQWVLDNGCDGLNILGSTGEANSFDSPTRVALMTAAAQNLDLSRLMVGTGTPSLGETIALTQAADDLGYGVALVLPPYYYKPLTEDGLFAWYEQLNRALGARKIAVYFYNFPQMTGLEIPISVIQRLNKAWPERFCGIKDSSGNLPYARDIAAAMPAMAVFPSAEGSLAEAHASGFAGCISATTNQTGALCARLWANKTDPDPKLTEDITTLRGLIAAEALIPSIKYLVGQRTGDAAWENMVPPFQSVTDARKTQLQRVVDLLG